MKITPIFFILLIFIVATGCTGSDVNKDGMLYKTTVEPKAQLDSKNYDTYGVINNGYAQWCVFNYGQDNGIIPAQKGFTYLAAFVFIKNDGYDPISTDPQYWKLTTDGVTYTADPTLQALKQPITTVEHGGENTIYIMYLVHMVHGNPTEATLTYIRQ